MRYLLFAGHTYYPDGGWDDFRGAYGTIEDALGAWKQGPGENDKPWDWWHVVDTAANTVVARHDD